MRKDDWISNEVKILHKRHKVLDKPSVRILYEFCEFEAKKTDKILTVLRDNPNPASFIQRLIEKPQISEKMIEELEERYDKQFGVVQQTEPDDIVVPILPSFDFFAGVVGDCMITVMSYLDPYSFSSFAVCSSSIYKISRSEAHSEYYRQICMFLFDRQLPAVPPVCRFHKILGHALQNPLQYGPNALHGMTSDLRKYVWKCELEEFKVEKSYFSSFKSYERLFKECPRVHLNGLYVCKHKYVRIGQKDKHNPFTPIHVIHYYRYLRFFEDGSVLYDVSNRRLRAEQLEQRLGVSRLSQECIMGEYRQCKSRLAVKTVKANEVFSYEFLIQGNTLSVMSYQLQLMDSSEIKQTLFKSDPNKESLVFTYYHCQSMARENSGKIIICGAFYRYLNNAMSQLQESMNEERCNQIRQSITLTNPQLLQLTYDEEKFLHKLDDLNTKGCEALSNQSEYEASIYFAEAERILEYAAGCGKTIQRALITTILNNEASVYQRSWELDKSSSYVEAIIYNITEFLEAFGQFKYTPDILDEYSPEHAELATFLQRKLKLAIYHLQYCAISSQIKNHDTAFNSASKSIKLLQSFCQELNKYEIYRGDQKGQAAYEFAGIARVLKQLMHAKEVHVTEENGAFQKYLRKAKYYIRLFDQRIAQQACPEEIGNEFKSFMVGQFMQIELLGLSDKVDPLTFMQESLTPIKKTYLVIYISMGYFTMATELRHIVAGKYPADDQARKSSKQFKDSQVYHLLSIIIAAKFLPCASTYFDHIANSFKTNYLLDILGLSRENNGEMVFCDSLIFSFVEAEEEEIESDTKPEFAENISEEPLPVKMKQNHLKTEEDHLKISGDLADMKKRGSKSKSMKNLAKSSSANNLLVIRPNKTQDLKQLLLQNKMKSSRKKSLSKTNLIFKQRRPDKSAKQSNDQQNIRKIGLQHTDEFKPKSQKKLADPKNGEKPPPIDTRPLHSVKNKLMKPVKGKPREEEKKKSQRNLPQNARHSRYEDSNSIQDVVKSHRTPGKGSIEVGRSKQKSKKLKIGKLQNQGQHIQSLYHTIVTPKKKTSRQLK